MEIKAGQAEIKNKIITAVQEQLRSKEEHVKGKSNNSNETCRRKSWQDREKLHL